MTVDVIRYVKYDIVNIFSPNVSVSAPMDLSLFNPDQF